ncbi:MAG: low specificity L-threonine aldolase [Burkholderiales bacterium]|nr:low specificity L-threonine aldolase [Burkholderiales bacterium]
MTQSTIDFRSDNCGRAAPELLEALVNANTGTELGYGADSFTAALQARLAEVFETPVRVYPVPTGTAANAVALAASCTPFGAVYCSADAHINTAECNATSFFGGGTKLTPIAGPNGKVDPAALESAIATAGKGLAHKSQPAAVNLVQATDLGAVYSLDEIAGVAQVARAHGLKVHMDGARFANALAALGCTPADMSWRAGVDVLSFGVTKNGGLLADAIVVFNPDTAASIGFHLRRAGLVWSKMRFASAQIIAYVENDLWLRLARQANAAAAAIAAQIDGLPGVTLLAPVQANELFIDMTPAALSGLADDGILYYRRGPRLARIVCRWDTSAADIAALVAGIRRHAAAA